MNRIDLARLRKAESLSQRKLAEMLDIKPSFLSAIENGRSRLPDDKLDKLRTIFGDHALEDFYVDDTAEPTVPPHTHIHDEGDSLTRLLNHFHNLAHKRSNDCDGREKVLTERIEFLSQRNDRLSDRLDTLREEVDALRNENLRLKEILIRNGLSYSD